MENRDEIIEIWPKPPDSAPAITITDAGADTIDIHISAPRDLALSIIEDFYSKT